MSDELMQVGGLRGDSDGNLSAEPTTNISPHKQVPVEELQGVMEELIPSNGAAIGNKSLSELWIAKVNEKHGANVSKDDYWNTRNRLIEEGQLETGG
jgi:hypothetical protein